MNPNKKHARAAFIIVLLTVSGCYGGSRGIVRFDDLRYPASMSSYLYGPNDELLARDRDLVVIKRFRFEVYYPAVLYSLVSPRRTIDIGREINRQVEQSGGDAVVDVRISSTTGVTTYLHPLTLLPFWPSYTTVTVEGAVVKYEPSPSSKAPRTEFEITEDVLIIEPSDDSRTLRLHEHCSAVGKADTLFANDSFWRWEPNARNWKSLRPVDADKAGQNATMLDRVKEAARRRGADVAQVLYVTLDPFEVKAKSKNAVHSPDFSRGAALDVRYWSCAGNQRH